jgi:hypothetical protein
LAAAAAAAVEIGSGRRSRRKSREGNGIGERGFAAGTLGGLALGFAAFVGLRPRGR